MKNISPLSQKIIEIIRKVTGRPEGPVALHEPTFSGNAWNYVKDCIDTNWVSNVGKYVARFEQMLSQRTAARHVIATVNGTAALHICLLLAGVKADDEVLMPALTFVATANAAAYCNAVPHFVDVDHETMGVCPVRLSEYLDRISVCENGVCRNRETGRAIRALVVMHCFGHPAHLDELKKVCDDRHIALIEDAAEAMGSLYHGRHVGNHGLLSMLSFNGNKTITTGGGGMILTNEDDLGRLAKHVTTTAKVPHAWEFLHDMTGFNYRLPNVNAALGCAQMEMLPQILRRKREIAQRYHTFFAKDSEMTLISEPDHAISNYWLNAILLPNSELRDGFLEESKRSGIMSRPAWTLMNKLNMYSSCLAGELPSAMDIASRLVNLPSSPGWAAPDGAYA